MTGINVMCKGLHFGKCQRLPFLTHNVFNAFSESGIVAVPEDTFIPAKGWLKEYQGGPLEIGKHEGHLVRVIGVDGIAVEKEIAKENKVVELSGFRTVKGIVFLGLSFLDRRVTMAELLGHEHNCFS